MTDSEITADIQAGTKEWSKEYDYHINHPPQPGDILKALGVDAKVQLLIETEEGSPPFVYGRAYVPEIVGQQLGWFLVSSGGQSFHGWKCILLPRARTDLIRKFGLQSETIDVGSLRVVRHSQSGKSLLCEVHDYGIKEVAAEPEVVVSEIAKVEEPEAVTPNYTTTEEPSDHSIEPKTQKPELTLGQ